MTNEHPITPPTDAAGDTARWTDLYTARETAMS
jgi:hypothetical protein